MPLRWMVVTGFAVAALLCGCAGQATPIPARATRASVSATRTVTATVNRDFTISLSIPTGSIPAGRTRFAVISFATRVATSTAVPMCDLGVVAPSGAQVFDWYAKSPYASYRWGVAPSFPVRPGVPSRQVVFFVLPTPGRYALEVRPVWLPRDFPPGALIAVPVVAR